MRYLIAPVVFALLAPLSACYVDNRPQRLDGGAAADDAPAAEDAGFQIDRRCETDADCGDNARCIHAPSIYFCQMNPPPPPPPPAEDAGVAPPTAAECRALCDGRACGVIHDLACGDTDCGSCGADQYCDRTFSCVTVTPPPPPPDTRPRWTLRVTAARVTSCNTDWDRCAFGPLFCTPSLPDPVVQVNNHATGEASNTCAATYDDAVGNLLADELAAGFRVTVTDNDTPVVGSVSGDTICAPFTAAFDANDIAAGHKTFSCSGGAVDFTLTPAR